MKRQWIRTTIRTNHEANKMLALLKQCRPTIGAFDSETNGLHIAICTPFLFQFGFLHPEEPVGYTFVVDLERQPQLARQVIECWHRYASVNLEKYLAHNVKFDLHMLANVDLAYTTENLSDTMFYIRYAHDAVQQKHGGPTLKLKEYASQYVTPLAKAHEKVVLEERTAIAKEYNILLRNRLKGLTPPPEWNAKSYTLGVLQDMFKDPIADYTWLPADAQEIYSDWLTHDVPLVLQPYITSIVTSDLVPYNMVNRDNLIAYAHEDIVYVLEIYELLGPIVDIRENRAAVAMEESLIIPLWEMERVGFQSDKRYLLQSKEVVRNYIIKRRNDMYELCQRRFNIGQHAVIKEILDTDFNLPLKSTNSDELDMVKADLIAARNNPDAVEFITILQELRTLEKWYSAYIMRFIKTMHLTDRLYTTINQVGTVTGRVTSDFQQFPKDAILTSDGEELFNPRKIVLADQGDYSCLIFLDYSQIELRFQAFYTILVGHPDKNLCQAYMPYMCQRPDGTVFDYTNIEHIVDWEGEWYYCDNPDKPWEPTDVHSVTTENATGLDRTHPDFKLLRTVIGKRVNFAKNYGAQRPRIKVMFPDKTPEEIDRINDAYYKSFPGVRVYHDYCYRRAAEYSYTENLFGVKYYGVSGHKLINSLVQGSAAFYLKWKIRETYDYIKALDLKSQMQMNIHDELSWRAYRGEEPQFFEIKRIMEDWPDTQVPVVAEMEITKTNWAAKKGVHNLDEIINYLSA